MYPGLSEADCQVAAFRYRQFVAEGQHQQFVADVRPGSIKPLRVSTEIQHRLGALLVRAGHCLQGLPTATSQSLDTGADRHRLTLPAASRADAVLVGGKVLSGICQRVSRNEMRPTTPIARPSLPDD